MTVKAPFPYYGGKQRLARVIAPILPPHNVYIEPFFGGGSMLFAKTPAKYELVNDLDHAVVAFFRVLRERPDDLIRALSLTPVARDEFIAALPDDEQIDDLEVARRFFVRITQGIGNHGRSTTGFRGLPLKGAGTNVATSTFNALDRFHEIANRLRKVVIENCDALELIAKVTASDALIYVDPPYPKATRNGVSSRGDYRQDMPNMSSHYCLLNILRESPAMVILSGYTHPLYESMLKDWHRYEISTTSNMSRSRKNTAATAQRTEILWSSVPINYQQ